MTVDIGESDFFLAGTEQDDLFNVFRQIFVRCIDTEMIVIGQSLQHLEIEGVASVPALDRTRCQWQGGMKDDPFRVEKLDVAKPVTIRAGTHRVVE